jgi:hypothetical protein
LWKLDEGSYRKVLDEAGGGNSTVESHSSKVMVAGSNPVPRSKSLGQQGSRSATDPRQIERRG